jgi:putative endonuclease
MKDYVVYVLSNSAGTLYIGVTGNLDERLFQHGDHHAPNSFVARYNLDRLVYTEIFPTAAQAMPGRNNSKAGPEQRSTLLSAGKNPEWRDLSADYGLTPPSLSAGG